MYPSISVIIPVYNVEVYLEACIDSVLNQTRMPNEIILVDDGSTDCSGAICDAFSENSDIIRVIHKANGGLSDARNVGIREATSEYLMFLDSDDTILSDAIEKLGSVAEQYHPEVVVGNVVSYYADKVMPKVHSLQGRELINGATFLKTEMRSGTMYYEAVQGLYEKAFLLSHELWFVKGLLHEDQVFTTLVYLKAERVVPTELVFYNHMIREESISTQKDQMPNAKAIIQICGILKKEAAEIRDSQLRKMVLDHCVSLYYRAYIDAKLINHPEIRIAKQYLIENSYSIRNRLRTILYCTSTKGFYRIEEARRKMS